MKKLLLPLILVTIILSGCQTFSWNWSETAYEEGWIPPEEIPSQNQPMPLGPPLPKPQIPILQVFDEEGVPIQFTVPELMELTIQYANTIDKFKYLVEIYERQYTSRDLEQAYMPEMSIEELKLEYFRLLGVSGEEETENPEE